MTIAKEQAVAAKAPTLTPSAPARSKLESLACVRCGAGYEGEVLYIGAAKIKRSPVCPSCKEAIDKAEQERIEEEQLENARALKRILSHRHLNIEKYLEERGVPLRYRVCSKENFEGNFPSYIPAYIYGPIGCGKTHLAVALMRERILSCQTQELPTVRFVRMVDLLKEIRQTFKEDAQISELDLLIYYGMDVDLLVLDDLGVEKITDWVLQTLYDIVDKRYVEIKDTIITSNIALKEFEKLYGEMGRRLASRIVGMGDVLVLKGKDRRI